MEFAHCLLIDFTYAKCKGTFFFLAKKALLK